MTLKSFLEETEEPFLLSSKSNEYHQCSLKKKKSNANKVTRKVSLITIFCSSHFKIQTEQ